MTETADQHMAEATRHHRLSIESFERSDTDGAVTQWAHGVTADEHRLKAWLAENDNKDYFAALFSLDGSLVAAKLVNTRYGLAWAILATDDPSSSIMRFVSAFPRRQTTMSRKGFYEGTVRCGAYVALSGSGTGLSGALSVRPHTRRVDRGFSRNVEIIDNGKGPEPAVRGNRRS